MSSVTDKSTCMAYYVFSTIENGRAAALNCKVLQEDFIFYFYFIYKVYKTLMKLHFSRSVLRVVFIICNGELCLVNKQWAWDISSRLYKISWGL